MPTDFMKRLLEKGSAATLEYFAKAQIAGRDTGLRQVDWVYAIQKFADLTFPDKLTPQQRFSRALDTPEGMLLFKAMDANTLHLMSRSRSGGRSLATLESTQPVSTLKLRRECANGLVPTPRLYEQFSPKILSSRPLCATNIYSMRSL